MPFDHEKLHVYQTGLQFITWVTPLLEEVKEHRGTTAEIRDQLDRASISVVLNTAEGNGKQHPRLRAHFFETARGSATECAAGLDVLVAKGITTPDRVTDGKSLLFRVVQMLTKMLPPLPEQDRVREAQAAYDVDIADGEG